MAAKPHLAEERLECVVQNLRAAAKDLTRPAELERIREPVPGGVREQLEGSGMPREILTYALMTEEERMRISIRKCRRLLGQALSILSMPSEELIPDENNPMARIDSAIARGERAVWRDGGES